MDASCVLLTCILLLQMIVILTLLNPVYDVRKITNYINKSTTHYKKLYYAFVISYFVFVVYLGMYIPLQNIHSMIFSDDLDSYDKLILLSRVEKNYIIAGYSLFLVVVLYGVRALLAYTANLVQMVEKSSDPVILKSNSRNLSAGADILPNLLRVKRSISYEAILCTNELKEQLKLIMKNLDYSNYKNTLSSIIETSSTSQRI